MCCCFPWSGFCHCVCCIDPNVDVEEFYSEWESSYCRKWAFVLLPFLNFSNTFHPLSTSDHHGFILSFCSNAVSQRPSQAHTELCGAMLKLTLIEHLDRTDWNSLCSKEYDVNQLWSSQYIAQKVLLAARKHLPWVNPNWLQEEILSSELT